MGFKPVSPPSSFSPAETHITASKTRLGNVLRRLDLFGAAGALAFYRRGGDLPVGGHRRRHCRAAQFLSLRHRRAGDQQPWPPLAIPGRRGAISVVDNTWATPLYLQPLALGADVSVHAATKYIGGHSDLLIGTVTANQAAWPALRDAVHQYGLITSPDDCWLALRGLRSLAARLTRHRENAERLIAWLRDEPEVARVLYPALPEDPGHALWRRDASITERALQAMIDGLQLFGRGYSWGGFESLLIPARPERTAEPLPRAGPMFRISAGLEDADDLIADLRAGFERLRAN